MQMGKLHKACAAQMRRDAGRAADRAPPKSKDTQNLKNKIVTQRSGYDFETKKDLCCRDERALRGHLTSKGHF